jgi:hypothetical protein
MLVTRLHVSPFAELRNLSRTGARIAKMIEPLSAAMMMLKEGTVDLSLGHKSSNL